MSTKIKVYTNGIPNKDREPCYKLIRFKDNTYYWINYNGEVSEILKEKEAIAFGKWNFKINIGEIKKGIRVIKSNYELKKEDTAVFSFNTPSIFLFSERNLKRDITDNIHSINNSVLTNNVVPINVKKDSAKVLPFNQHKKDE